MEPEFPVVRLYMGVPRWSMDNFVVPKYGW